MRKTTQSITILLFYTPISAGSNYTLSLFLIPRFKSLRNGSNIFIGFPDLPLSFDIAWYEQMAIAILLALFHLGVYNVRRGPTLPGFLTPNMVKVMVEKYNGKTYR